MFVFTQASNVQKSPGAKPAKAAHKKKVGYVNVKQNVSHSLKYDIIPDNIRRTTKKYK